ncbi:MAG: hypothetical protein JSW08_03920 [archaeon]|nr:MAG: hypothetical protein JSW08_03920 [archaeon]
MFIKKIFENRVDESVHNQFTKFGKGTFNGRAIVTMRITPSKVRLVTSFDMTFDLIEFIIDLVDKVKVKGKVLSRNKLNLENEKKGRVYEYSLDKELSSKEIKDILEKCYFPLLNCEAEGIKLKIGQRLPKPGKDELGENFSVLDLDLKYKDKAKRVFFWDILDFKKAKSRHTFEITEIIMPKGEKDFAKIRILAKRKGKIIRKLEIDGKKSDKESDFVA